MGNWVSMVAFWQKGLKRFPPPTVTIYGKCSRMGTLAWCV